MRTVYLEPLQPGDLVYRPNNSWSVFKHELMNLDTDSVFFITPVLRRSIVGGVKIVDYDNTRKDRVFGAHTSREINGRIHWR